MAAIVGQPVPDWELPSLFDPSRRYRLRDYLGQVVVVLFWSANPLTKRYQHYLDGFVETFRSRGVTLLAVDPEPSDSVERVRLLLGDLPHFPVLRDEDGAVARAYGVSVIPTVYVADEEGILRYWGAIDDRSFEKLWPDQNYLEEAVERLLLDEEVPDPHNPPVGYELKFSAPT